MKYSGPSGDLPPRVTHTNESTECSELFVDLFVSAVHTTTSDLSKRIEFLFPFVSFKIKAKTVRIDGVEW